MSSDLLIQAAETGDAGRVIRLMRFGQFDAGLPCARPRSLSPKTKWQRLARVARTEPGDASPIERLVRFLAGARASLVLVIGAAGDGVPGIHIGLEPPPEIEDLDLTSSVGRLLAPNTALVTAEPPSTLGLLGSGTVAGFTLRLAPRGSDRASGGLRPTPGLLDGLLRIMEPDWILLVTARPTGLADLDSQITRLMTTDHLLAQVATSMVRTSETQTITIEDTLVAEARLWLDVVRGQMSLARAEGAWGVTGHVASGRPSVLALLKGALSGTMLPSPSHHWVVQGHAVSNSRGAPSPDSLLATSDLAALIRLPAHSLAGLRVRDPLPPSRVGPAAGQDRANPLGCWIGTRDPVAVTPDDLIGHGFVVGATGSGKSTTVRRLVASLWNTHRIPFLVIDPVKADYELLAQENPVAVQVLSARNLSTNVLRAEPGFDPAIHLEYVADAFRGSFAMPAPVPYVVTQLFEEIARRASWDPPPTLHDLRDLVDEIVPALGYHAEVEANVRAALRARLGSLLAPGRAERHAAPVARSTTGLFDRPTIVRLDDVGDDDERSFLMALLAIRVAEHARQQGACGAVRHVLVLEEAHRVMGTPVQRVADPDVGDPGAVASRLFTRLLTEMRSFGESVLVVDQSPARVDRDVLKNTNLKIAHRVTDPLDRAALGGSLGLTADESDVLAALDPGEALLSTRRYPEPQAILVHAGFPPLDASAVPTPPLPVDDPRLCCRGRDPEGHHLVEQMGDLAEEIAARWLTGVTLCSVDEATIVRLGTEAIRMVAQRRPGSSSRCLTWVGLRRATATLIETGALEAHRGSRAIAQAFEAFDAARRPEGLADRLRRNAAAVQVGPYPACRSCPAKCRFRAWARSDRSLGLHNARTTLDRLPLTLVIEGAQKWMAATARELAAWFGESAVDAARCAITQALYELQAPWSIVEAVLDAEKR